MERDFLAIWPEYLAEEGAHTNVEGARQAYRRQDFTPFSDLKSLNLFELRKDLPAWR
jgi:hypothetical protein